MTKNFGLRDYIFKDDLMDTPLVLTTIKYNDRFITLIENVPVHTFRNGAHKQDVVGVNKTMREAMKFHKEKYKESISAQKGVN